MTPGRGYWIMKNHSRIRDVVSRRLFTELMLLIVSIMLLVPSDTVAARTDREDPYWISRASMPTPRQEVYPALLDGRIYVVGGFISSGGFVNRNWAFEIATDAWYQRTNLPAVRHHVFCVAHDGLLYAIGGFFGNWLATNTVFAYDPIANGWTTMAPLLAARGEHVAASYGGEIFVFGGRDDGYVSTATTQVYDPVAESWSYRTAMPTARAHSAVAVVDDLIYVIGGRYGSLTAPINMDTNEAYSPATDQWIALAPMPDRRGGHAAAAHEGKIYVFGGENLQGTQFVFDTVLVYDPALDAWDTLGTMTTPRHGTSAITVNDTIFVVGGADQPWLSPTGVNEGLVLPSGSVAVDRANVQRARLYGARPNPFNPRTIFRYELPATAVVHLTVYDLTGRLVRRLVASRHQVAGSHEVVWSGTDDHGRSAASGVYVARLQAGQHCASTRVVLVQ